MCFSLRNISTRTNTRDSRVLRSSIAEVLAVAMVLSHPVAAQQLNLQNVVRDYGYIPMPDGVNLAYVVYRPTAEGRYPILLEYSPYNVDGTELNKADTQ